MLGRRNVTWGWTSASASVFPLWEFVDKEAVEEEALQALIERFGVSNGRHCMPSVIREGREADITVRVIGRGVPLWESGHEVEEIQEVWTDYARKRWSVVLVEVWDSPWCCEQLTFSVFSRKMSEVVPNKKRLPPCITPYCPAIIPCSAFVL